MMIGTKKKGSISEEDISLLLQRYTATAILALLQEVAQSAGTKIDWNALVKKTSTGISNVREYQMLWRHLAYRNSLAEKLEDGAEPSDDDSDLEFEVEPFPAVTTEASTEAAACVKVLIASGSSNDSGPLNHSTVEAPLTINIPNGQASRNPSDNSQPMRSTQGTNITVPVSVQKQHLPMVPSTEGLDGNGSLSSNLPAKKKRKFWTPEEDMELIAAVQKCGEGNWANILRGDFKHDRTASQLSQRWAIIRKRQATLNPSTAGSSVGAALSEAQLAARQAVSIALNMPMMGSLSSKAGTYASTPGNSSTLPITATESSLVCGPSSEASTKSASNTSSQAASQGVSQSQQAPNSDASNKGKPSRATKSRAVPAQKTPSVPVKCSLQEVAFAAGARIANPSTAASLLKAAQSRNAVHIRQGGTSLSKSSLPSPRQHGGRHNQKPKILPPPAYVGPISAIVQPVNQVVHGSSVRMAVVGQSSLPSASTSPNLPAQQMIQASKSAPATFSPSGNTDNKSSSSITGVAVGSSLGEDAKCADAKSGSPPGENETEIEAVMYSGPGGNNAEVERTACSTNEEAGQAHSLISKGGGTPSAVEKQKDLQGMEVGQNQIVVEKQKDCSKVEVAENQNAVEMQTDMPDSKASGKPTLVEKSADSPSSEGKDSLAG